MRLIGNKKKLLREIAGFLRDEGVREGTVIDIFSGTASVANHLKRLGYRVFANDHMAMCYSKAVAGLEVNRFPSFQRWRRDVRSVLRSKEFREEKTHGSDVQTATEWRQSQLEFERDTPPPAITSDSHSARRPLEEVIRYLNTRIEPREGLFFRNFCSGGPAGRGYFADENGRRIDGIVDRLAHDYRQRLLTRPEFHLLLSALIDAADRVANISGTYGAFLKRMQPNALKPLTLEVPSILESSLRHRAYREDANRLVRRLKGDVLYIDPPYNHRQYAANYHILQILAEYHEIDDLCAYEARLYGKTGLRPYADLKSLYCIRPSTRAKNGNVFSAMTDLILSSRVKHVMISYNEEGLLSKEELGVILARFSGRRTFSFEKQMREMPYRRFRSDTDRDGGPGGKRRYKVLDGRGRDEICEWLLFASRAPRRSGGGKTPRALRPERSR